MTDKPMFERGQFTDWLLDQFGEQLPAGLLIGDAVAPDDGGWQGGQPGQGIFASYTVLITSSAQPTQGVSPTTIAEAEAGSWTLRYTLRSFGGVRQQADWCADKARAVWHGLAPYRPVLELGTPVQPSRWRVERPTILSMGGVVRSDQVNPPQWEVTDELSVVLNRSRT